MRFSKDVQFLITDDGEESKWGRGCVKPYIKRILFEEYTLGYTIFFPRIAHRTLNEQTSKEFVREALRVLLS